MTLVHLEADPDLGVSARVLDLLIVQDRLPETFNLQLDGGGMTLRMRFPDLAPDRLARMVARMRQISGVRSAAHVELAGG